MVAPVRGADSVDVYFSVGSAWTDMWTGQGVVVSPGTWWRMPAPLGYPAAFLRRDGHFSAEIGAALRDAGLQTNAPWTVMMLEEASALVKFSASRRVGRQVANPPRSTEEGAWRMTAAATRDALQHE